MSVARFIADQRTNYRVPHTVVCAMLGVSLAWFYKWLGRADGPAAASGLHTPPGPAPRHGGSCGAGGLRQSQGAARLPEAAV